MNICLNLMCCGELSNDHISHQVSAFAASNRNALAELNTSFAFPSMYHCIKLKAVLLTNLCREREVVPEFVLRSARNTEASPRILFSTFGLSSHLCIIQRNISDVSFVIPLNANACATEIFLSVSSAPTSYNVCHQYFTIA